MNNIRAEIYIEKTGETVTRRVYIILWGAEFTQDFYTKKQLKNMIDFLKFHNILIKLHHVNYNCKYMDLPF